MNQTTEFIVTKEYRRFTEFCYACKKEKYIGVCYGPAGVGKSMAAYQVAQWQSVARELEVEKQELSDYKWPLFNMQDFDTIIYTAPVSNTASSISSDIEHIARDFTLLVEKSIFKDQEIPWDERFKKRVQLLIIDEADRLQPKSLEQVRDIYDRQSIAIILIGMPGIEKRLIRFPQLYSRIGFSHTYKSLGEQEVTFIIQNHLKLLDVPLDNKDFSDQEAIASFTRITQGNFRLINRLLKQTIRVMEINQLSSITKEVVEAARECLVIGNVY